MPGDLLDLILIALIAAFAVAGYRQGFIIGILSLAGFVAGVVIGADIAPDISHALAKSASWQAFTGILTVFAAAVIGMLIASGIGVAVRSRLTGRPATLADSLGGAAVNVVAVLIVAWLIGSLVANSPFPVVDGQVNNSAVLRTLDRAMPGGVMYLPVFPQLRSMLQTGLNEQVFSAIGAETSLGLAAPDPAVLTSAGLAKAAPSVVKIEGEAPACSEEIEGSGFVISRGHVLTNAHVVAGVTKNLSVFTEDGRRYDGQVVLYDPERDLAVIDVPGLSAAPLQLAPRAAEGADAIVVGYPENHGLTVVAARVGRDMPATGPNIYQTKQVTRDIYPVRASILPGNSGGPLLSTGGEVYGVVFAASTYYSQTGYALTANEVSGDVAAGAHQTSPVSTQSCQGD